MMWEFTHKISKKGLRSTPIEYLYNIKTEMVFSIKTQIHLHGTFSVKFLESMGWTVTPLARSVVNK